MIVFSTVWRIYVWDQFCFLKVKTHKSDFLKNHVFLRKKHIENSGGKLNEISILKSATFKNQIFVKNRLSISKKIFPDRKNFPKKNYFLIMTLNLSTRFSPHFLDPLQTDRSKNRARSARTWLSSQLPTIFILFFQQPLYSSYKSFLRQLWRIKAIENCTSNLRWRLCSEHLWGTLDFIP